MKHGNWVPISKAFAKYLPKGRPYTELEAAFSMQVDYDNGNTVTIRGYADLWRWSVGKVYRFLDQMGVKISYPGNTRRKQNQRGTIMNTITERKQNEKGMIRFIDSKGLQIAPERKRNESGTKTERSWNATNDPNPKPNKKYSSDSAEIGLSTLLLNLIFKRNAKFKKPNLQKWAKHVDLAMRLDGRTTQELEAIIRWCQADAFWQNNILSTEKLRSQFDKLWMQMETQNGSNRLGKRSTKYQNIGTTINFD
jgi:hypothetical protein